MESEMRQAPLLATIAKQLCGMGTCLMANPKAKLPVCSPAEAQKLESCILDVKAKIKETGYKGNPFAICRSSVGCRLGGKKEKVKV